MPWKESQTSDERLKFIAQVLSVISVGISVFRARPDISARNDMRSAVLQRWSTSADDLIAIPMPYPNPHGSASST